MDWIHCNKCFVQLEPGIKLHLTSCGHMFCNKCLNNGVTESTCLICRVPCSIMKLVPDMNQEIQDYFTEPEDIIKKSCAVLHFQRQHRRRLLSYLLQSTKKFYAARTELRRVTEICQKQHKQLKDYQKVIKTYQSQLANNQNMYTKLSPSYNMPLSPNSEPTVSPPLSQTPTKRNANSTPYSINSNSSNKTVYSPELPDTPESVGTRRNSPESGYRSSRPLSLSPGILYCSGLESKCCFRKKVKITKQRYI